MNCSHSGAALLLALFVTLTQAVNYYPLKTEYQKGVSCAVENKPLGPFYIPDNQCSGVLYDLPNNCERLEQVRVTVLDYANVKLSIHDSLLSASIERVAMLDGSCPGRAMVRVHVGCAGGAPGPRSSEADYVLPAQ